MPTQTIPFDFILDYLIDVNYKVKPMFGCFAIYVDGLLCFFVGQHKKNPLVNGVSIATSIQHSEALKKDFPKAILSVLKEGKCWLMISEDLDEFESYVIKACHLCCKHDKRIGRIK